MRYKYRTNRGRNLSGDAPAATELPLFEYKVRTYAQSYLCKNIILKPIPDEPNPRAPYFEMKIRGHTIWENTDIKLMCRVAGNPAPKVTWYHNKIPIEVSMHGIGKYKITQDNGIHYLEISRAQLCDAGNYRCSAQNYIGEVSDYAALTVKQYNEEKKNDFNISGPSESGEGLKIILKRSFNSIITLFIPINTFQSPLALS